MRIDGQCHCGAVAFVAEVDPDKASVCHCTDCQCFSGAPFRASVPVKAEDFRITSGIPKIYVKTADSGARRAQGFCENCGAPIFASDAESPKVFNLRLGVVRQRAGIVPRRQIWRHSALAWALEVEDLPSSPGQGT
jgi:hypothetical protein